MNKLLPILSKAESYTVSNEPRKMHPSPKKIPYSAPVASGRVKRMLSEIKLESSLLSEKSKPDGKIVTKLTLHPSFLAKSYFPKKVLKDYGLISLGSKEVLIEPSVRVTEKQKENTLIATCQFFISGQVEQFEKLYFDLHNSNQIDPNVIEDIKKIEDISIYKSTEKFDQETIETSSENSYLYEVVLYTDSTKSKDFKLFKSYINSIGGDTLENKARSIDGLTFILVEIKAKKVKDLASFSYVRVVRKAPIVKASPVLSHYEIEKSSYESPPNLFLDNVEPNIAIFDAGLNSSHIAHPNIRYFDLTDATMDTKANNEHGSKVASAIVYGDQGYIDASSDILSVDHYKVISHLDNDGNQNLYDVLERIESVLSRKKYRFVNICLGPPIPRPDDEPNLWTSVLDKLAENGETLFVVAAGNEGDCIKTLGETYARVQPPADMINGLSVGSASSRGTSWERANYSCIGPGRRPGHVKPDVMFFGGDEYGEKVVLAALQGQHFIEDFGTSFAAPLITRQAALIDKYTNQKLSISAIRALLVHSAEQKGSQKHTGWGKVPSNITDILSCTNNRVTFLYQGELESKSGVRAAIPFTKDIRPNEKVVLNATMCFYTEVDIKNPSSYTKTGVEITFKPNLDKFPLNSKQPKSRSLFSQKNIYQDELHLREDLHKWETCFKVSDRMKAQTLNNPVFDIRFSERDEGHNANNFKNLKYSLIVTIEIETDENYDLYNRVINKYPNLLPIDINLIPDTSVEVNV